MPQSFTKYEKGLNTTVTYNYVTLPPDYYSKYYLSGTSSDSVISTTGVSYRNFIGTKTIGYRQNRRNLGFLPTLPCTDERYVTQAVLTQYVNRGYWDGRISNIEFRNRVQSPISLPNDLTVKDEAWSKLRQKIMDQDINVGVVLAEANKTSDLIYDTARRIALAIRALRKGDMVGLKRHIPMLNRGHLKDLARDLKLTKRDIHSYWLELQYGWKPLLMDVHGGAVALAKTNVPGRDVIHVSASSHRTIVSTFGRDNLGLRGSITHTGKCWLTYKIRNDGLVAANRLGLLNPALIAWELVPFSFVADWFVNIGDVIKESTAFAGLTILDSGSSYKQTATGLARSNGVYQPDVYNQHYVYYKRLGGYQSVPRLRFNTNPFSLNRILNGAALIRQVAR